MNWSRRRILAMAGAASVLSATGGTDKVLAGVNANQDPTLADFACNLDTWWTDLPFLKRAEMASRSGFSTVEFWSFSKDGRSPDVIARHCHALGLRVAQFTGWFGPSLADRENHTAFREAIGEAIIAADTLAAPMFTVVGHKSLPGISARDSLTALEQALRSVVPALERANKMLILEPFNPVDHPGFFLNGSADALAICRAIASDYIKINWDFYHMALTEGQLETTLSAGYDQAGYLQLGDVPGRHQPGTGGIDFVRLLKRARKLGYTAPVGLEFWPDAGDEARALAAIRELGTRVGKS